MAINLNDMMQGGFSGSSGPSGDVINVGGRRLKKTPMGWQDIETGEIADDPQMQNAAIMNMSPEQQMGKVNLPPLPISDEDKRNAFRLPSQETQPMANLVNGQPMGAQQQPENFFQRSGGERVSLRPDTGWTTQSGKPLVPKAATERHDPWFDGPKVMEERTLPDGRVLRMVQKPVMDRFGRQSSMTVPEISDPNAERMRDQGFREKESVIEKNLAAAEKDRREGTGQRLSPTELKAQNEIRAQGNAKKRVSGIIDELKGIYGNLEKEGATVKPEQSAAENMGARLGGSWLGQTVGGIVGTKEQTMRDKISQIRPLLVQEIRRATDMGAKGMDSNVELQFYLNAATDVTRGLEANLDALDRLNKAYGLGMEIDGAGDSSSQQSPQQAQPAAQGKSYSLQDIKAVAAKRGVSVEKVMADMRAKGIGFQ